MNIITANLLLDGAVVYRDRQRGWVKGFALAARFSKEESPQALEEAQRDVTLVVKPYLVPLEDAQTIVKRERNRETIRAYGPSVLRAPMRHPETGA